MYTRESSISLRRVLVGREIHLLKGMFVLLALVLGARIGKGIDPSLYVFIVYGVILVTMLVFQPLKKVYLYAIFILPIIPNYFDIQPASSLPYLSLHKVTLSALSLVWIARRLVWRKKVFVGPPFTRWLLLYAFLQGLSLLVSVHGMSSLFAYIRYWLENYIIFFMTIDLIREREDMISVFRAMIVSAVIVSVIGLVHYFTGKYPLAFVPSSSLSDSLWMYYQYENFRLGIMRINSVFTHSIILGMFLNLVLPAALILFLSRWFRENKTKYLVALIILSATIILTLSRAAWVASLVSFSIVLWSWQERRLRYLPLLPLLFGGLLFFFGGDLFFSATGAILLSSFRVIGLETSSIFNIEGIGQLSSSTLHRWPAILAAWYKIMDRPFLGYGVMGNDLRIIGQKGDIFYFLKIALDSGIPSLVTLLAFLGHFIRSVYRASRRFTSSVEQALVVVCLASIISYLVNLQGATFPDLSYLFWIVCGIATNLIWRNEADNHPGGSYDKD
jgi:hypothetical protein